MTYIQGTMQSKTSVPVCKSICYAVFAQARWNTYTSWVTFSGLKYRLSVGAIYFLWDPIVSEQSRALAVWLYKALLLHWITLGGMTTYILGFWHKLLLLTEVSKGFKLLTLLLLMLCLEPNIVLLFYNVLLLLVITKIMKAMFYKEVYICIHAICVFYYFLHCFNLYGIYTRYIIFRIHKCVLINGIYCFLFLFFY